MRVLFIQCVPPLHVLGVWETELVVSPNMHSTQQDLYGVNMTGREGSVQNVHRGTDKKNLTRDYIP